MYRLGLRQAARKASNPLRSGPRSTASTSRTNQFQQRTRARLDGWISRSPKFFKPTLTALRDAPTSYIVSFAVLHEITAVVPLVGLFWFFHQTRWLPEYFADGKWMKQGVERFGRYFRKKGWISEADETNAERQMADKEAGTISRSQAGDGSRMVIEAATAWALVKLLLPFRIALSVWAAPASARLVTRIVRKIARRNKRA
jgi:hypothetical protein